MSSFTSVAPVFFDEDGNRFIFQSLIAKADTEPQDFKTTHAHLALSLRLYIEDDPLVFEANELVHVPMDLEHPNLVDESVPILMISGPIFDRAEWEQSIQ